MLNVRNPGIECKCAIQNSEKMAWYSDERMRDVKEEEWSILLP